MKPFLLSAILVLTLSACATGNNSGNSDTGNNPNTTQNTNNDATTGDARIPAPTYGSGDHTLTVYADFQCPACQSTNKNIMPIMEEYAKNGYLKIVYKQFPLTSIHQNAERDALAYLCVASQSDTAHFSYKKALYELEEYKRNVKVSDKERVAASEGIEGINQDELASCLANNTYIGQVRADIKEGEMKGVNGTPTLFIDDKRLDLGLFRDLSILKTAMDKVLGVPADSQVSDPSSTGSTETTSEEKQ